jgi:hypothetical protein
MWQAALLLALLARGGVAQSFAGKWVSGEGDTEYLALLDTARRAWEADPEFQSVPQLYSGSQDGLLEGPTWDAWWTQNSYGTSMTSFPFLPEAAFAWTRHSQAWWFNNMADGTQLYSGNQGWAPDGCLCDNGSPTSCNYKQVRMRYTRAHTLSSHSQTHTHTHTHTPSSLSLKHTHTHANTHTHTRVTETSSSTTGLWKRRCRPL